jgi:phosphoesterase RecJ-like protein
MLKKIDPRQLWETLQAKPKVLITVHRGPDGDAIGSALGLAHFLKGAGVSSSIVVPDEFPDFLKWLPGANDIVAYDRNRREGAEQVAQAELIFCLDFNRPDRMSDLGKVITHAGKPMFVIDHHRDPAAFADAYYVDSEASSTAELIYRLISEMGQTDLIDVDGAMGLYTGLVTDTGSFRFSSVSPQVMRIAATLMEKGVDHTIIYDEVFDNSSLDRLKLRGYALYEKTEVIEGTGAAYIHLTSAELQRFNYRNGDTEGLVNYALGLEGVHVAGFFYERDGYVKISLRSKGQVDVNIIASACFNGGGHKNAAGGRSADSLEKTIQKFEQIARSGFQIEKVEE